MQTLCPGGRRGGGARPCPPEDDSVERRKQSNFPGSAAVKNLPAIAGSARNIGLIPWSGRSPGRGNGSPLQYSSLENPRGQRSPAGYSPRSHKESDMTDHTCIHPHPVPSRRQWNTIIKIIKEKILKYSSKVKVKIVFFR